MDIDRIEAYFATLTAESLDRIGDIYTADAYFKDPFNEVRGLASICAIYAHMFDALIDPRFAVVNRIVSADQAMLEWDFTFRIRRFRPHQPWNIHGTTHLRFDGDGRIAFHRDYWDTGEELYARLPVIGAVIRFLRKRMG
ncbi:MAG: nuclear transport factor 2 family protein [Burkholderiales bacterium]|nr:nuclear transport factor 2 family protein [Burkholderiales bacterium]